MVTSRLGLEEYCLRKLGHPVHQVNITDEQISDRIDDALQFFGENIFDGIEKVFLQHTVTSTDITNRYIPATDPILGVIRIFPSKGIFSGSFFDQEFQLRVTDLNTFTGVSSIDYYVNQLNFSLLEKLLATERSFTFNKKKNQIGIDSKWGENGLSEGDVIVIEAYAILDPQTYTEVYNDSFLKEYATALIKQQWGMNLSKFENVQLPTGITVNGGKIFDDATEEIKQLIEDVPNKWTLPPMDILG